MTRNAKISVGVVAVFAAVIAALLVFSNQAPRPGVSAESSDTASLLVRPDSHRLSSAADSRVTFVEFLDFECEGCRAAYPSIERLRQDYAGRVTFVVRYFPLPGHYNGMRAAQAVEAAAQQGKFEQMYQRMFETQSEWGEQQTPKDDVFRGFAADLGLDMTAYDATYNDPATLERIRKDVADGQAFGVDRTPTVFLNGSKVKARDYAELTAAVDAALNS